MSNLAKARDLFMSAAGALLYLLSMPPVGWWAAAPVGLFLLFYTKWRRARTWMLLGTVLHLALYFWLINVTVLGWIALSLIAAIFWAVPFWAYQRWPSRTGTAALWVAAEGIRAYLGWGWLPLAASAVGCAPLLFWARLGGESLIGFILVFGALTLVKAFECPEPKRKILFTREFFLFLLMAAFGGCLLGNLPAQKAGALRLGIVQPCTPTKEQYSDADYQKQAVSLYRLSVYLKRWHPDIVLWPEEALCWSPVNKDPRLRGWLESGAKLLGRPIVCGALWREGENYYNAVGMADPAEGLSPLAYKKRRLVVFGEYIPFSEYGWARSLTPVVGSFNAGKGPLALPVKTASGSARLWPLICYEDIFDFLSDKAGQQADLIGVFINDGWFGPGAMQQHAAHSILRSVEQGIPLIRVSNSGLSALVLPDGSCACLESARPVAQIVETPLENVQTPYRNCGPLWRWGISAAGIFGYICQKKKNRKTPKIHPR